MNNGIEEEKKVERPKAQRQNLGVTCTVTRESVSNAFAWGDNRHGQLGVNSDASFITSPALFK